MPFLFWLKQGPKANTMNILIALETKFLLILLEKRNNGSCWTWVPMVALKIVPCFESSFKFKNDFKTNWANSYFGRSKFQQITNIIEFTLDFYIDVAILMIFKMLQIFWNILKSIFFEDGKTFTNWNIWYIIKKEPSSFPFGN